jgi:FAD synthetase
MKRIINTEKAIKISKKLKRENKKLVLAGGCFDILHAGHIKFLTAAKKRGDVLFILLESDKNVEKYKGKNRPINSQEERAMVLSSLRPIDYIIILDEMRTNSDYDKLIIRLKPDIIATTKKNQQITHNIRQAKLVDAELALVINRISNKSTTKLANIISQENQL